ncbi:MAG: metal ABC transporter permease [Hyphomicrobiales bacterium]|nr:metal ABC transporter permease [Hyphomicrobiales bacterium]
MLDGLFAPFVEFAFMRRALAGILALALSGAPLGVLLMLRRMSLTGDGLSHAILPGTAIAYAVFGLSLWHMTLGGFLAGGAIMLLAGVMARTTMLKEDATLASFYLISLALGVMIVSLRGSNVDLMHFLFGSVLALDDATLLLVAGIASVTLVSLAVLWRPLVLDGLDPGFLRTVSRSGAPAYFGFMILLVLNLVAGFHALGTLLAVGFLVLPAVTARFWARDLSAMVLIAGLVALGGGLAGLLVSYHASVPSGPAMILALGLVFAASVFVGPVGSVLATHRAGRHRTG